jgi:hypothetical protein
MITMLSWWLVPDFNNGFAQFISALMLFVLGLLMMIIPLAAIAFYRRRL